MKKYLLIVGLSLVLIMGNGQNMPFSYQYLFNPYLLNPAVAGSNERTCITLCDRHQWLGFEGSPTIQSVTATTRINKHGMGLAFYNDRNGALINRGLKFTYAFHIKWGRFYNSQQSLSLGISFSGLQYVFDQTGLETLSPDNIPLGSSESAFLPDADVGVYYYGNSVRAGLSVMQLLSPNNFFGESILTQNRFYRRYCLHAVYNYEVNPDFVLEPGSVVKITENFRKQLDINLAGVYKYDYRLGLSYRHNLDGETSGPISTLVYAGVNIYERYTIHYGYDVGISKIYRGSGGTHEFGLSICFDKIETRGGIPCPAYN